MTATVTSIKQGRPRRQVAYRAAVSDELLGPLSSYRAAYLLHLQAKGQSGKTIEKKLRALDQLTAFLGDPEVSKVSRTDIEAFMVDCLERTARSSANTTFNALRAFFGPHKGRSGQDHPFLTVEIGPSWVSPMADLSAPGYEEPEITPVSPDFLAGLLRGIEGKREKTWEDVRDLAILRIFIDTGCRLSEVAKLTMADILPMDNGRTLLRVWGKGKGGGPRERHVPLGEKAGLALRRYLRARGNHPHAASPNLWLGTKGPILVQGVRDMVYRRTARAGQRVNPHKFRHAWAVAAKRDARNRDEDIMYRAGWVDPKMLARYGRKATAERAIDAFYDNGAPGDAL